MKTIFSAKKAVFLQQLSSVTALVRIFLALYSDSSDECGTSVSYVVVSLGNTPLTTVSEIGECMCILYD